MDVADATVVDAIAARPTVQMRIDAGWVPAQIGCPRGVSRMQRGMSCAGDVRSGPVTGDQSRSAGRNDLGNLASQYRSEVAKRRAVTVTAMALGHADMSAADRPHRRPFP